MCVIIFKKTRMKTIVYDMNTHTCIKYPSSTIYTFALSILILKT